MNCREFRRKHDAYVDDLPNRVIMSKLCISDGTFSRRRRQAVCAVATAMLETSRVDVLNAILGLGLDNIRRECQTVSGSAR